jgi:hypothetical protein
VAYGGTRSAQTLATKTKADGATKQSKRELMQKLCYAEWGGKKRTTKERSNLHPVSARHDTRDTFKYTAHPEKG